MKTLWKYLRPGRHRPGYIAARRRLVALAVAAALVGLGCTGPDLPADEPEPYGPPATVPVVPLVTPDPGVRPPALAVP